MADVFFHSDAVNMLEKKHVIFFGDSNTRAVYKDLVWLLNHNELINQADLKRKQERSFSGDRLGKHTELIRGREYEEERSYEKNGTRIDFYFITKCHTPVIVDMMEDIHLGLKDPPDVIYINSTFWDVCRWGPDGVIKFKDNVNKLAKLFKLSLPKSTLVIWATALPVSHEVKSSLLIKQVDFLRHSLRFDVVEANQFARDVMVSHGFDVLDNHFHMRMQIHRRVGDGVHYLPVAIRFLTNLLLTHIALSWGFPLPGRVNTILLDKAKGLCPPEKSSPTPQLVSPQILSNKNEPKKKKPPPPSASPPPRARSPKKWNERKPNKYKKKFPPPVRKNTQSRYSSREALERPGRVKTIGGKNKWASASDSKRGGWAEKRPRSPAIENPFPPPQIWSTPSPSVSSPQVWSEDHWPDDHRFDNEPRFNDQSRFRGNTRSPFMADGPRYTNEQRFPDPWIREEPRFFNREQMILQEAMRQRERLRQIQSFQIQ